MMNSFAKTLIENWRLGHIATADADGRPNLSPKGTFVVHDDVTLGFAEIRSPDTMANIAARPEVEVSFVDILTRRAVLIQGTARAVTREDEEFRGLSRPYRKLWPDLADSMNAIVLITVSACRPTSSPAYDVGADTEDLRAHWMQRVRDINIQHKSSEVAEC